MNLNPHDLFLVLEYAFPCAYLTQSADEDERPERCGRPGTYRVRSVAGERVYHCMLHHLSSDGRAPWADAMDRIMAAMGFDWGDAVDAPIAWPIAVGWRR
jgi:hypothetical protein